MYQMRKTSTVPSRFATNDFSGSIGSSAPRLATLRHAARGNS